MQRKHAGGETKLSCSSDGQCDGLCSKQAATHHCVLQVLELLQLPLRYALSCDDIHCLLILFVCDASHCSGHSACLLVGSAQLSLFGLQLTLQCHHALHLCHVARLCLLQQRAEARLVTLSQRRAHLQSIWIEGVNEYVSA